MHILLFGQRNSVEVQEIKELIWLKFAESLAQRNGSPKGGKRISPSVIYLGWFVILAPTQTHLQSQRALLLQGTDSLNNASLSIERSQRIAAETEHIGNDIIEELGGQREQLDRTRNRVSWELLLYFNILVAWFSLLCLHLWKRCTIFLCFGSIWSMFILLLW